MGRNRPLLCDYLGKRFCERVVIGPLRVNGNGSAEVLCRCDYEHETWGIISLLKIGKRQACTKCRSNGLGHPLCHTAAYRSWTRMRRRVKNDPSYAGRIKCCPRWQIFDNFLADMGHPSPDKPELDRIDGHKDYEPTNCRWASKAENNANRTTFRMLTYDGKTMCITHWEKYLGVNLGVLRKKLRFNRPLDDIMVDCGYKHQSS